MIPFDHENEKKKSDSMRVKSGNRGKEKRGRMNEERKRGRGIKIGEVRRMRWKNDSLELSLTEQFYWD